MLHYTGRDVGVPQGSEDLILDMKLGHALRAAHLLGVSADELDALLTRNTSIGQPSAQQQLMRIFELLNVAMNGHIELSASWLRTHHPLLGATPLEVMKHRGGMAIVSEHLEKAFGAPAA